MIPTKIDFLGHQVDVEQLTKEAMLEHCGDPEGGYNFGKLKIYINHDVMQSRKEEILLHEIMEMLIYYAGGFGTKSDFNHSAFQKYVSMLYAIMKQNGIITQEIPEKMLTTTSSVNLGPVRFK